jgi:uncharacterized protein YoxC
MVTINTILPWLYGAVGIVLIWLIVELAITMRNTRKTINDMKQQVDKVAVDVSEMTTDLKPAIKKVDPLMDRVAVTVDAVNLEVMRLDGILGDVSTITEKGARAANSLDDITSAPMDLVNSVADKVKRRFGPKSASEASLSIAEGKVEDKETAVKKLVDAVDEAI